MDYIYHMIPENLQGDVLYPLKELKSISLEIYDDAIKKYSDHPKRKILPDKKIPLINCTRGDVLHCCPIDPRLIFKCLEEIFDGYNKSVRFYKIPINLLTNMDVVFFDINDPSYTFGLPEDPVEAFNLINVSTYKEPKSLPPEARDFYLEWKDRGGKSAPAFGKIPHVFVKGSISIDGLEIIDWSIDD